MNGDITFEQWLNRFFFCTEYCRDLTESDVFMAAAQEAYAGGFGVEALARHIEYLVWTESF